LVATAGLVMVVPRTMAGPAPVSGRGVSVLSFNVFDGRADVVALGKTIRASRPDLVVLPEAGVQYRSRLVPLVSDLGYRAWTTGMLGRRDVDGIVVLAAPSLGDVAVVPVELDTHFRWMQLSGGSLGSTRVIAVHVAAPVRGLVAEWARELLMLQRWCGPGGGANVLIGDFNATLDHSALRSGTAGCADVAAERGEGLVPSWPTYWPGWFGVQIDHVFTSAGIRPASLRFLDLPGSDHRGLLTQIMLPSRPYGPAG
ncbi:MAG: endonuclease/exonuclease/phosphatase family protein, partial [Actinobacteria bacterium]|nr:endonuclease/exonuclease/phosphatase family protein [Actinomycetota bacterium]